MVVTKWRAIEKREISEKQAGTLGGHWSQYYSLKSRVPSNKLLEFNTENPNKILKFLLDGVVSIEEGQSVTFISGQRYGTSENIDDDPIFFNSSITGYFVKKNKEIYFRPLNGNHFYDFVSVQRNNPLISHKQIIKNTGDRVPLNYYDIKLTENKKVAHGREFFELMQSYTISRIQENKAGSDPNDGHVPENVSNIEKFMNGILTVIQQPEEIKYGSFRTTYEYIEHAGHYVQLYNPKLIKNGKKNVCFWNCIKKITNFNFRQLNAIAKEILNWDIKSRINYSVTLEEIIKITNHLREKYSFDIYLTNKTYSNLENPEHQFISYNPNALLEFDEITQTYVPTVFYKGEWAPVSSGKVGGILFVQDSHVSILVGITPIGVCPHCTKEFTPHEISGKKKHTCSLNSRFEKYFQKDSELHVCDTEGRVNINYRSEPISFQVKVRSRDEAEFYLGLDSMRNFILNLIEKDEPCTIIFHNGSNYDAILLFVEVLGIDHKYIDMDSVIMGGGLKSFVINGNIHVVDSCKHISGKLSDLCKDFNLSQDDSKISAVQVLNDQGELITLDSTQLLLHRSDPKKDDFLSPSEYIEFLQANPTWMEAFKQYSINDVISLAQIWELYTQALRDISGISDLSPENFITAPQLAKKILDTVNKRERQRIINEFTTQHKLSFSLDPKNQNIVSVPGQIVSIKSPQELKRKLFDQTVHYQNKFDRKIPITKIPKDINIDLDELLGDESMYSQLIFYSPAPAKVPIFDVRGMFHDKFLKLLHKNLVSEENIDSLFTQLINTHIVKPRAINQVIEDPNYENLSYKLKQKSEEQLMLVEAVIGGISYFKSKQKFTEETVYDYDVVSLYPYVMRNFMYPYGPGCKVTLNQTYSQEDAPYFEKFGVYRCINIFCNREFISDVPVTQNGILNWTPMPSIPFKTLTSVDIKRILEQGGSLTITEGFEYDYVHNPFKVYVDLFFARKQAEDLKGDGANASIRNVCKLMLNSIFGKFMRTKSNSKWHKSHNIVDVIKNNVEHAFFIPSQDLYWYRTTQEVYDCPIQLGIFVLAHSRNYMQSLFDQVGRENVLVSETDSIFIYKSIGEKAGLTLPTDKTPTNLGAFSIAGTASEIWAAGKKCYLLKDYLKNKPGSKVKPFQVTCKGVPEKFRTQEMFETLLKDGSAIITDIPIWRRNLFQNHCEPGIYIKPGNKKI